MNTTNTDKIKDRIRNLLNLANDDSAAEGEINNALRFAHRLMMRHGIDKADLTKDPHEIAADTEYNDATSWSNAAKLTQWDVALAKAVELLVGSVKFYTLRGHDPETRKTAHGTIEYDGRGNPRKGTRIMWYGPGEDVADAASLYAEWQITIAAMARMKFGGASRGPGRSYAEGFASALRDKVRAIRDADRTLTDGQAAAQLGDGCTALMVQQRYDVMKAQRSRADHWLANARGIRLVTRAARTNAQHHGGAHSAGRADGSRANFARTRTRKLGNG